MTAGMALFLSVLVVSLFSFISVAAWTGTRHQERKDFYRSETLKKLAESGPAAVVEYLREEERLEEVRRARQRENQDEGTRLAGMILVAVGVAMMIAFQQMVHDTPVYLLGLIPAGIGVVLFFASRLRPGGSART